MSYWTYYLLWMFFVYALQEPWLLAGIAVLLLARRVLPDPGAIFRALRRRRALRAQVDVNPANVTARRDLAIIYLDLLRPRAALTLLEQALSRAPDDAELLYLCALALHRSGRHEEALPKLVRAIELDGRVRFGLPFMVAGDALSALGRWDAALDAYERYVESNSSDVAGYTRLARAHARAGDREAARKALGEAIHTWSVLPGRMEQRSIGRVLAAQWARVWLLREPLAMTVAATLLLVVALLTRSSLTWLSDAFDGWRTAKAAGESLADEASWGDEVRELRDGSPLERDRDAVAEAYQRCGTQSTGSFVGRYVTDLEDEQPSPTLPEQERAAAAPAGELVVPFEVTKDRVLIRSEDTRELCLTRVLERTEQTLRAEIVSRVQGGDLADAHLSELRLERGEGTIRLYVATQDPDGEWELRLRRVD